MISVHSFCASDAGLMFNAARQVNRPSELRNVLNAADGRGGQENSARRKGKLGEFHLRGRHRCRESLGQAGEVQRSSVRYGCPSRAHPSRLELGGPNGSIRSLEQVKRECDDRKPRGGVWPTQPAGGRGQ